MPDGGGEPVLRSVGVQVAPALPDYLVRHYRWAYLRPTSLRIFDRPLVVSAILWGQYRRLSNAALAKIAPGANVLQLACSTPMPMVPSTPKSWQRPSKAAHCRRWNNERRRARSAAA
ncbi:hypothetical protein LGT41_0009240 [Abyssibius alkaniclasticus]|uniref:hypothetical protein n=1 Tax=Abyssibius alkaniclasticus TaxID=2881234 RepID=UPI002363F894|nr:hypothetical protein [Abyssibius alkaniclasticus]UPH70004.1 hypothetical protein LGT41_0009240 [Abyssibius alkaniclasticus]